MLTALLCSPLVFLALHQVAIIDLNTSDRRRFITEYLPSLGVILGFAALVIAPLPRFHLLPQLAAIAFILWTYLRCATGLLKLRRSGHAPKRSAVALFVWTISILVYGSLALFALRNHGITWP